MPNIIPAAPIHAQPVVIAGPTGPTGPPGAGTMLRAAPAAVDPLVAAVADLTARVEALEKKAGG